jgi:GNAT superfamily N-acetyltransferase
VTITAATSADLDAIARLFERHTGRPADQATFERWIDTAPSAVARDDGDVVGYAVCQRFAPDVVELAALLVEPSHRGQGIGMGLVDAVEAGASTHGFAAIVVVTSDGYEVVGEKRSARPFYERRGYSALIETDQTVVLGRHLDARAADRDDGRGDDRGDPRGDGP